MSPDTAEFLHLLPEYLEKGVKQPVPDYATTLVVNRDNYAYFSHLGKADAMNYSTAVFLINDDVRALYVIYQPDPSDGDNIERRYLVKTLDRDIDVDDYVVVPSTVGHKLTVAKVVGINADVDFDSMTVVPWVVQRVNMIGFNQVVKLEEQAIETIKAAEFERRRRNLAKTIMSAKELKSLPLSNKRHGKDSA